MKQRRVSPFIGTILVAACFTSEPAWARINGIASSSCSGCHGSGAAGVVSITGPSSIEPGDQITLTVTITNPGIAGGGFFISNQQNEGTFSVISGEGTKVNSNGVGHSNRKSAVNGAVTFNVNWTAPASEGASRFNAAGVAANADGRSSGDQSGQAVFDVVYGCEGQTVYRDYDGDGYGTTHFTSVDCGPSEQFSDKPGDCNENNSMIHPGATEICNLVDDNCNDAIDEGLEGVTIYRDADGDGYGVPTETAIGCGTKPGFAGSDDDCNDSDALMHPNAGELCNGRDDDCDQDADEDLIPTCGVGICVRSAESCFISECIPGDPEPEICNGLDDDCNGATDDGDICPSGQACIEALCVEAMSSDASNGGGPALDGGDWEPTDAAHPEPDPNGGGGGSGQAGASQAGMAGVAPNPNGGSGNGSDSSEGGCTFVVGARGFHGVVALLALGLLLERRRRTVMGSAPAKASAQRDASEGRS